MPLIFSSSVRLLAQVRTERAPPDAEARPPVRAPSVAHRRRLDRRDRGSRRARRRAARRQPDERGERDERSRVAARVRPAVRALPAAAGLRRARHRPLGDAAGRATSRSARRWTQLADAVQATGATESALTYDATGDRSLVSPDGHATMIPITLAEPGEDHIEDVHGGRGAVRRPGRLRRSRSRASSPSTETSGRCRSATCRTASCVSACPPR